MTLIVLSSASIAVSAVNTHFTESPSNRSIEMANEVVKKGETKKPEKKTNGKKKFAFGSYLKEMWGEVKKLTWLSPKELAKNTGVVIVVVLAFTILIYVLDFVFGKPMQLLLDAAPESAIEFVAKTFLG